MHFTLIPLGTGAALPARGRSPAAQILNVNESLYLIDCGEGTQERIRQAGLNFQRIGHIFISHMHGDHFLGLMGLLSTMHLLGRQEELHVHGPRELREVIGLQQRVSESYWRFPLHHHDTRSETGVPVMEDAKLTVTALALKHRLPCTGFVFREKQGLRPLRAERVREIPQFMRDRVKHGDDLTIEGKTIPNAALTHDPPPPRSYAYCSDTAYTPELVPFLNGVDLLYHEATFTEALRARAKETMHSTAREAALIARDADVGRLMLGHFSSRYKDPGILLKEALEVFPRTVLSEEGVAYPIDQRSAV